MEQNLEKENPFDAFICDGNDDVGYFDRDKTDVGFPTSKELLGDCGDQQLLQEIENEIEQSKSNFFRIDIVFEEKPVLPTKQSKPAKSLKELPALLPKSSKSLK